MIKDIDEFINSYPEKVQEILEKIRKMGQEIIGDELEETISYGIPTMKRKGKHVFYFSAYKTHIGIYPIPELPDDLKKELEPYIKGKGTLQFPLLKPIPFDLIEKFIKLALEANKARTDK